MYFLRRKYYNVARGGEKDLTKHITLYQRITGRITQLLVRLRELLAFCKTTRWDTLNYLCGDYVCNVPGEKQRAVEYLRWISKIGSDMSPDSELVKKYGAGKTKTTEIINNREITFRF